MTQTRGLKRVAATLLSAAAIAACDAGPDELAFDSKAFEWRYAASGPYLISDSSVNRLTPVTVGDRVFVAERNVTGPKSVSKLRIVRLDGGGKADGAQELLDGIAFEFRDRALLIPIEGAAPSQKNRYLLARYAKDSDRRTVVTELTVLTVDADGRLVRGTNPTTIRTLYGVKAAWMDPKGGMIVVGPDATRKRFPLRIVRLKPNGDVDWQLLPWDFARGKKFLSSSGFVGASFSSDGVFTLIGTDGHWHEKRAVRDIYRLDIDPDGRISAFKPIFEFPEATLSDVTVKLQALKRKTKARPLLFSVRRIPDGGFVGIMNGWFGGSQDGLRVIAISPDGSIRWVKTHGVKKKGIAISLAVARNGAMLAANRIDKIDHLYLLSSTGDLISSYRLKDLAVDRIERHPVSGFLIWARQRNADGDERLTLMQFRPPAGDDKRS